jgi:predicted Zn-dependent peptidase
MRRLAAVLLLALPLLGQEAFTLPGGLRVKLFENHERPYLEARVEVAWEAGDEQGGLTGAGTFLGALLESGGAGPYSPLAWRKAMDAQGILLRFEAAPGRYIWTLQCPSESQEAAFEFLAHALARPLMDGPAVETQRSRLFRERQRRAPAEWAEERFGWDLLEGRPEGRLSESRLTSLSLEQLLAFQNRVLRPGRARLALYGDLSPAQARKLTQLHLGIWGPSTAGVVPQAAASAAPTAGLALPQGRPEARLALLAPGDRDEDSDLLALLVDRWLQHPAAAPPGFEASLLQTGLGPCLMLRASGPPGADPLALLASLRTWANSLAARPLGEPELALARHLRASRDAALGLNPPRQLESAFRPSPLAAAATPASLKARLARWLAPDRMRVLMLGISALPKEHPALQGLGAISWMNARD